MKSLYINPETNDLEFDSLGELKTVEGKDELIQSLRLLIKTNLKEWFLDPSLGFNYETVFVKKFNEEQISEALIEVIQQEERIDRIETIKIEFDRSSRTLSVFFIAVSKEYGEIPISEVVNL